MDEKLIKKKLNLEIAVVCLKVGGRLLDGNNIGWRWIDDQWIGKRTVWTNTWRAVWLEEVKQDEHVKTWWCGEDADYDEIFTI